MERSDVSKILFIFVLTSTLLGLTFLFGLYSGARKNAVYDAVVHVKETTTNAFGLVWHEARTFTGLEPTHFLAPAVYPGAGVALNDGDPGDLILLSGFFDRSNELRLIRRNGEIVRRWPVSFQELFPDPRHMHEDNVPSTDWNIDLHGALAMPDGSVVFNFEYGGTVRLGRCGEVVWKLAEPTHHSVERAEGGGFWIPSRRWHGVDQQTPFPPFNTPLNEDTVLRVSDDGTVLEEISVPRLFYDNGLETLLTATGEWFKAGVPGGEIVHVNKIEELTGDIADDFPGFEAGDLALSIRESNLIIVVAPDDWTIKWWQIGPWVRQHDPEFKKGGTIALFNNNLYRSAFGSQTPEELRRVPRVSNVMEIEPVSRKVEIKVGARNIPFSSVIRGKVEVRPDGGFLVTEFQNGRVFEANRDGALVWEYINRYDDDRVAELTEASSYPSSYFRVEDWSCP